MQIAIYAFQAGSNPFNFCPLPLCMDLHFLFQSDNPNCSSSTDFGSLSPQCHILIPETVFIHHGTEVTVSIQALPHTGWPEPT